jgi:hypothetical protein
MTGYPLEKLKRIKQIVNEENRRASATDNHNIQFRKLRTYVEEMVEFGHTFLPQKQESPGPLKRQNSGVSLSNYEVASQALSAPVID